MRIISIKFILLFFCCSLINCENKEKKEKITEKKTTILENNTTKKEVKVLLTLEEKNYIEKRLEEYINIKQDFNNVDKSNNTKVGQLNKKLSELPSFPEWFSKNTPEIRYLELIKMFTIDIGNSIATRNNQLLKLSNADFEKYSSELKSMLKE
ncbi:hypothetical protein [Wenyingzhuangia sp. 2_MG-2023]|uniref:hypothetical protein n=1 Tax=Wenyingzhuangia sp. 2_MG-2023 TaxID=3062639 RepID=UPI0026E2C386|nr:hypothetical protein [Wenyingzhuangia sp. 2_MG-2023]MDO6739431.1 hypothetical protein [Wenyingzhuangia sp. 2_MG-2023]